MKEILFDNIKPQVSVFTSLPSLLSLLLTFLIILEGGRGGQEVEGRIVGEPQVKVDLERARSVD